ncbi:Aerobic-type carbon monoxide dehydrogenase, subunit CoxM [Burkholderiales bacterium]|nr:Aerobic-type carbon monoxide dehydrogenase, subunit CoxM [Burkholderiales bacterium]
METQYHRPASVAEAAKLLAGEARLLAGGQSLVAAIKLGLASPSSLVDLRGIAGLDGIRVDAQRVSVGAMATHASVAASKEVARAIPALAQLAAGIGDRQVRACGTIGGSLANNDPAACYPAAVLGLGASVQTDQRQIAADDFFLGMFETALRPSEIITAVHFPIPERAAYEKFHQPASRFSLVGVMVAKTGGGVRVAVTGAGSCVFRCKALEVALTRKFAPESCDGVPVDASGLNDDLHGSAAYRAHLIPVLAKRAVARALG